MFTLKTSTAKGGFFDRERVVKAVTAAEQRVLSRFGAFVRQRARSSMRRRKSVSDPGQPPSAHTGALKERIFFSYDFAARSVVIGPTAWGKGEAPRLLEYGGTATRRGKPAAYRPRPFMGPAFRAELPRVSALWRDAVRAA